MKLGLVSAILESYTFEEVIDYVASVGLDCVELACWPAGNKTRRYAGVSHLDVENLDEEKVNYIRSYCKDRNVEISSLAYYPNPMTGDTTERESIVNHLKRVIRASQLLGVNLVTTFLGRDQNKTVSQTIESLPEVWQPLLDYAENLGVRIAIENCPMYFTEDEWPGGQNIMTSPSNWRKVFEVLDSPNLGINYDPSHFVWQQIDYIKPIYEFKDKIFFVHFKDIKVYPDKLADVGTMATPLEYMTPKIPGYGDIVWKEFISALSDIKYRGFTSIEIEDISFEESMEEIDRSIQQAIRYLKPLTY